MVRYISTGRLPTDVEVQRLVERTHRDLIRVVDGEVSSVYPALRAVTPDLFGICVAGVRGSTFAAGDVDVAFALMSVAKPFVLALAVEAVGVEAVVSGVGVDATGRPFDSVDAVRDAPDGRTNPMVNAGAIATAALIPGGDAEERWQHVLRGLSAFAGRPLEVDLQTYASASATNLRNRQITAALGERGRLSGDPAEALDRYTRQSCLTVTARDLAVMGATLADGGVNPVTGEQCVTQECTRFVLAVMATAGMYTGSGQWLCEVGLPAKSGIGGGIVTVAPGKGGMGTYSPRLDTHGNSVRGGLAAKALSEELGLDLFASAAAAP
jgi:glutaminase